MKIEKMHMNTNARIVSKVLTRNKNTFYALKELINNSIQANATRIIINLIPSDNEITDWQYRPIERIQIKDNGHGVSFSKFPKSILELATDNKPNGFGVGRFSGLQLGRNMFLSTIGYDENEKVFTETKVEFDISQFEKNDLTSIDLSVEHKNITTAVSCGYNVEIYNLYSNEPKCPKKNKLGIEFLIENFSLKIFEQYPLYIFDNKIRFIVNGHELDRSDFIVETPKLQRIYFTDLFGNKHEVKLQYFNLKLNDPKVRLFIQCYNGEIKSTALELTYNSMWYSQNMGTQYVLIESDYLKQDFIETCALGELNKEWQRFAQFLKESIDDFYKKNNTKYKTFIQKLKSDKAYPFSSHEPSSTLATDFFEQSAFILEEDLNLLSSNDENRTLIYLLLRKVIEDGNLSFIINHVMGLSKKSRSRLIDLLDKTNLEEVINFSTQIANRLQSLNLIEKIVLNEIDKHVSLYAEVSKIIFRNSWLLGDEYLNSIPSQPQQTILDLLESLFSANIPIKSSTKTNNINRKTSVKRLQSQIICNERRLDYGKIEISVVILFAPSICIGQYETSCIDNFLFDLGNSNGYPIDKYIFKIYFIGTQINDFARQRLNRNATERFVYPNMNSDKEGIRAYLMDWPALIDYNRDKLSCASETLKTNRIDVETTFLQEYPDLFERKNTAQLRIIN
ncbi:ATP-binding protein [uncultured Duncaniella sp.]|uniref:ATP-binding protein n=1 Tax=uncultured Duncaniella sp. TaxID=2768039 RepID=UPI0026046805|nr:ATP-binding protein [uncultured Duncaniella sp.]